ncbi:MAG: hypothetical protein EHM45_16330 [Desulfobacteraceae bacterium]|nr:MAG: hypothetical protein EHM45_16330 [Desulfobacteraceae bacterium]
MNQKLKIALIMIGVFILGVIILSVVSNKKIKQEKEQKAVQSSDERAAYKKDFNDLIQELKDKNILSNSAEFLKAYDESAQDPVPLIQLATAAFKQNPQVGLQIMSLLCVNFSKTDKANETLHNELSLLFYKDKENFLNGLTGDFKDENINCLLNYVNFPTEVSEKPGFDLKAESKKIVDYLSNHRLKDNQNVIRLIERFGDR